MSKKELDSMNIGAERLTDRPTDTDIGIIFGF